MSEKTNIDALRQLLERLRRRTAVVAIDRSPEGRTKIYGPDPLCAKAADAIEAMATELEALRASRGRVVEASDDEAAPAITEADIETWKRVELSLRADRQPLTPPSP